MDVQYNADKQFDAKMVTKPHTPNYASFTAFVVKYSVTYP